MEDLLFELYVLDAREKYLAEIIEEDFEILEELAGQSEANIRERLAED